MSDVPLVEIETLGFAWPDQPECLSIDRFILARGESLFLEGPSGSGKTTLLGLLGGVQRPSRGSVRLLGKDLSHFSTARRDRYRVDHTGFLFQQFNLLPFVSVLQNVLLPCDFSPVRRARAAARHGDSQRAALALLCALGLDDPALPQRPARSLSIGQQQRVAAARALIGQPELIIADEPTSALDADHRDAFLALLFAECAAAGAGLLFVSHDRSLAGRFSRRLTLAELNTVTPRT